MLFLLGLICCVLLLCEKAMVDEIARETALGWEVIGEWVILYIALVIQLVYIGLVLRAVKKTEPVGSLKLMVGS